MAKSVKGSGRPRGWVVREGYRGKALPAGAKPPRGKAADVPVKKSSSSK
jgi:hypothetical protein